MRLASPSAAFRTLARSSRSLATAAAYTPPLKVGELPAYDHALQFLAADKDAKLQQLESLKKEEGVEKEGLERLEVDAWVNDPETRWRAKNGFGTSHARGSRLGLAKCVEGIVVDQEKVWELEWRPKVVGGACWRVGPGRRAFFGTASPALGSTQAPNCFGQTGRQGIQLGRGKLAENRARSGEARGVELAEELQVPAQTGRC